MQYVVGVDAGGTSTSSAAFDYETGEKLSEGKSGFGNVILGMEGALAHLKEAIRETISGLDGNCLLILVGAAGAVSGGFAEQIEASLTAEFSCQVVAVSDARLALEGALEGSDGVLLISGTGSAAQGKKGDTQILIGGWGYLVGDEGSGYDLVAQCIREMVHDVDYGFPEKPLSAAVREFFGASDAREVIKYIHSHMKGEIAAATPVIVSFANQGDPDARALLTHAGEELGKLVICTAKRLKLDPDFSLALQGSVIRKVPQIRERMLSTIAEAGLRCTLVTTTEPVTKGAWFFARNHSDIKETS